MLGDFITRIIMLDPLSLSSFLHLVLYLGIFVLLSLRILENLQIACGLRLPSIWMLQKRGKKKA